VSSPSTSNQSARSAIAPFIICAVLALFVAVSALPKYASSWPWTTPPKVANQAALQSLRDTGLTLANWSVEQQIRSGISGDDWSIQQLVHKQPFTTDLDRIFLLLRPQVWEADQPEVEWVDIKGSQQWKTDTHQRISFTISQAQVQVQPNFFRAWDSNQTYAVVQWYAWPSGSSASVAKWFWADQKMQWQQHQRMPWVAVSLWLPIEPLGDITPYQNLAKTLGEEIHATLLQTVFTSKKS
jgi:cyanoexosortase B-associated protein